MSVLAQENVLIPMPGDDAPIPLPGDDAPIPLPGENSGGTPLPSLTSTAALPFDFRGYVENTTNVEYVKENEEEILLNAGRVRINVSGEPNEWLDFGIGLVGTINTGATSMSLVNYLPDELQTQILPEAEPVYGFQMKEDDLFVQEAFGTFYGERFRLRVGRHKFYTGSGYGYNPIDLFNAKDPLDPTYEVNGMDALLLIFDLPKQTELQAIVRYADTLDTTDYLLRLKTYLRGWDLSLQYTHYMKARYDWEAMNTQEAAQEMAQGTPFDAFEREFRWHLAAAEFSGELWEWGVYGEGGYVFVEEPDDVGTLKDAAQDHERLLIGIDHTFDFQLYVMLEYLRLGLGRTDKADITLNDRMAYFNGEVMSNNRDTLFAGMSYPLTDLLDASLYAIIGCNDSSLLLNPWLIYDVRSGLKLSFSANIPIGDEDTQLGKSGASGLLRLKFNF